MNKGNPRFAMGRLLSTPGALEALQEAGESPASLLQRHVTGDWGDMSDEDKQANELALQDGSRVFSSYLLAATKQKIWVISEATDDQGRRAATTILLPSEY
jgi:hypothetical protein